MLNNPKKNHRQSNENLECSFHPFDRDSLYIIPWQVFIKEKIKFW